MELWFRDDKFDDLVKTANDAGLKIASMCGHKTLGVGMNDVTQHDRIIAELRESIDIAVKLGIKNLITFSGNHKEGQSLEEGIQACVTCLKQILPYAEEHKINLNMELLNSKVNHPGYMCDHTAIGVDICKRTGSPRAKLLYDIYHMQIMEGDIIRNIRDNIQYIGHFHTAGNPGRNDMDDTQELNYKAICTAINETGYEGYLAHEFTPKADRLKALADAFTLCNG